MAFDDTVSWPLTPAQHIRQKIWHGQAVDSYVDHSADF